MGKSNKTNNYTDFYYHLFRNILLVSIPLLLISAIILSLPHSSAYSSSTDSVALTLPTACTISASVVMPHNATLVGGQVEGDIGNTKINAYCNDRNGYFIYAIGNGSNIDGETDLVFNNGLNSSYNIHTGVYNSGNTNSSWAMKLSSNNGTYAPTITNGYDNYNIIPNTDTVVAFRTSGTSMDPNTDLTGSYFNTTYQIYANSIQPTGNYLGKVKYTMTHPYDATQLTTIEKTFDIVGIDKITIPGIGSYYAMQDMSDRICSLANAYGAEGQLIDIRDNKVYYVSKLPDGHCWMTQNLDLDIGGTGVAVLTSENTDISTDASAYLDDGIYSDYSVLGGIYTWGPDTTALTSDRTINYENNSVSGWSNNNTKPYSAESGDTYYYTSSSDNDDTRYTSVTQCINAGHTELECKHYSAGNYYNWTAAIASNDSTNIGSTRNAIALNSICPKGWRLPNASETDNQYNEFGKLLYNSQITSKLSNGTKSVGYLNGTISFGELRANPSYFVRSGDIYTSSRTLDGPGVYGSYWSSVVNSTSQAYHLQFGSANIYTAYINNGRSYSRGSGKPVRCLARRAGE